MEKNKKIKLLIISSVLFLILAIGGVYAWLTFTTGNVIVAGNTHCFNINYTKGADITGNIGAIKEEDYVTSNTIKLSTAMGFTPISMELDKRCNKLSGIGVLELNVQNLSTAFTSEGNSYGSLKYVVAEYDPSLYTDFTIQYLKNQTFNYVRRGIVSETGTMDIHTEYLEPGVKHNYLVILYIDKNMVGDDIIGASITATGTARADQFVATPITDFTYVTGTYNGIQLPENTVLLTSYNGTDTVVNVPSTYTINDTTYNVMVISDTSNNTSTFGGNTTITEVNFADGVLFYEYDGTELVNNSVDGLFKGCTSLVKAPKLSDTITSMNNTYEGCTSLTNVEYVPSSTTSMLSTFRDCTNLEGYIRIPNENVAFNSSTFSGTTKNIIVEVPANSNTYTNIDTIKPNNVEVKRMGKIVTPYTDFTYILGSDQTEITTLSSVFYDFENPLVELDNVTLENPINIETDEILLVRYIGENTSVTVPESYTINGVEYQTKILSSASYYDEQNSLSYITGAFLANDSIQEVYLNENLHIISPGAEEPDGAAWRLFSFCNSLTTVPVIPKSVVNSSGMFEQCSSLNGNIRFYFCSRGEYDFVLANTNIFDNEYTDNQINLEVPENSYVANDINNFNSFLEEEHPNFTATIFESDYCPAS